MIDAKGLVKRLNERAMYDSSPAFQELMREAAAFIEAHDKPLLSREEMREMLAKVLEHGVPNDANAWRVRNGYSDQVILLGADALAFGEAIQRHFMGGE